MAKSQHIIQSSLNLGYSLSASIRLALQKRGYENISAFARSINRHPEEVYMCLNPKKYDKYREYPDIRAAIADALDVDSSYLDSLITQLISA